MISRALILALLLTLPALAADFKGTCSNGQLTTPPQPQVSCSATATTDSAGRTAVTFSNGLSFTGDRVGGDGPLFFLKAGSNAVCHFYFTDHGTFTLGWESRITVIECPRVQFTVIRQPGA
jgi:hypothetical protein